MGKSDAWKKDFFSEENVAKRQEEQATKVAAMTPEERHKHEEQLELYAIRKKLQAIFQDRIDAGAEALLRTLMGGHHQANSRSYAELQSEFNRGIRRDFILLGYDWDLAKAQSVLAAFESGDPLSEWVDMGLSNDNCFECGMGHSSHIWTNGCDFKCSKPCPYPDGIGPYDTYLNVPSGKMVIDDDLRRAFPVINDDFYVNVRAEIKRCSEAYAASGLGHGFCGNSCPTVYSHGRGKEKSLFSIGGGKGKLECRIGTDLWWYSVADHDAYLKAIGEDTMRLINAPDIVACKPGKYRITHHGHYVDRDQGNPLYASIEWVGECDPPAENIETTVWVLTHMGKGCHSLSLDTMSTWERARERVCGHILDCDGVLLTEEVYPSADAAARLKGPLSVKAHVLVEGGQVKLAPDTLLPELESRIAQMTADNAIDQERWEKERREKETPEQAAKHEADNAAYYAANRGNYQRLNQYFTDMTEAALRGEPLHDAARINLWFTCDIAFGQAE